MDTSEGGPLREGKEWAEKQAKLQAVAVTRVVNTASGFLACFERALKYCSTGVEPSMEGPQYSRKKKCTDDFG